MAAQVELKLLSERTLHHRARLLAYCPSMDLLAIGSEDQPVTVYRLNGQRVYTVSQRDSSLKINQIAWKSNGQMLAVAWNDSIIRLIGAESSKIIHQIAIGAQKSPNITCLSWTSNVTGRMIKRIPHGSSWKDILGRRFDEQEDRTPLDLPRDLSLIDIESSLPKLSPLPSGGTSDEIFSSHTSLDGLFPPFDPKDNDVVDVMIVGTTDGQVHLTIYDSFIIGSFSLPSPPNPPRNQNMRMVLQASHKYYSTHALLTASTSGPTTDLFFIPMDLRFVAGFSEYLSLLASRSTALQNLLRYINQVQFLMAAEWQTTQDLPGKFLRSINETLQESQGCDIVQALYHSVLTGHTYPAVREWLVDELAERGHKRWDKAVTTGLENLRKLVHEDMLPALERCALILSRLNGIIKFKGLQNKMGFSSPQIDHIMDTLACLNLVSTRILTYVIDELETFTAFSGWIRYEIDRMASNSSSPPSEDMSDIEADIDHSKVLLYIQTVMTSSQLSIFFDEESSQDYEKFLEDAEKDQAMFELLDEQLQRHDEGLLPKTVLPRVDLLCKHIGKQTTAIFQQIAEAEKKNVFFGQPTSLGVVTKDSPAVIRLCPEDENHCRVYISILSVDQPALVRLLSIQLRIDNGISTKTSFAETHIDFDKADIKDVAFLDNYNLLVHYGLDGESSSILSIPYQIDASILSYNTLASSSTTNVHRISEIMNHCTQYSFPNGSSFLADKFVVAERPGSNSQNDLNRLCVLDQARTQCKVFTIPRNDTSIAVLDEDVSMS